MGTVSHPTVSNWFDTSAFIIHTTPMTYGTSGINPLHADGKQQLDSSLFKTFHLIVRQALQFRTDAFNTFNHPNFSAPDSGVGDGAEGQVLSTSVDNRALQFALRYSFWTATGALPPLGHPPLHAKIGSDSALFALHQGPVNVMASKLEEYLAANVGAQGTSHTKLTDRQVNLLRHTFIDYQATSEFLDHPLVIERAEGLYYWDASGKRYFDAIGGIFVAVLGHRHPRVMQAMRDQMEKVTFAPPLHSVTNILLDFVEKVGSVAPGSLKYVKPFSGGSEAVESALKFARQYFKQTGRPNKYKFVSRYYAYHGGTFGGMGASGSGARKSKFEPQMDGFLKIFPPSYYRDRFATWEEANRFAARSLEDVIVHEDPATVAAFLVEPIGNTGGIITPTEEYFQMLRDICDRYDVLLIFDEVITGFAKTGNMFASQTFGVTPDIICAGKAISSGAMPLGAMIAREDLAEAFQGTPE